METCLICGKEKKSKRALATHLQMVHHLKSKDYTIQYILKGEQPKCLLCNNEPRYVSFEFKQYCKEHKNIAETKGGKRGGRGAKLSLDVFEERLKEYCSLRNVEDLNNRYEDYISQNEKNIKVKCNKCEEELTTSLNYLRDHSSICGNCRDRSTSEETKGKISNTLTMKKEVFEKRVLNKCDTFKVLTKYEEYGSRKLQKKLKVECAKCGDITKRTLQQLDEGTLCWKCNPSSKPENEVAEWVESLGLDVVRNSRKIIAPKEIDIYIPSKKVAIEYNGLYWHSELNKEKSYHSDKSKACKDKGIFLFHVFSDDWEQKQDVVKSMIKNKLGLNKTKVAARKCKIIEQEKNKLMDKFFNDNHLLGHVQATKGFFLEYNDQVVAGITLRKPAHRKYKGSVEVARFTTKIDTTVQGGFSKLLKAAIKWAKDNGYEKVITYADLSHGNGNVYEKNGFTFLNETKLSYWYTDGISRYNRFKFRAQDGKTEKQVAEDNGVFKIFGCGNNLYELPLSP
jgi:hypothetical protein